MNWPMAKKDKSKSLTQIVDALQQYMRQAQKYPLLSKKEEYNLAVKLYEHKNVDAAHKLVTSNLRFVVKIANEYASYGLKILDLIQEGNVGLMRAVKTFNPYKETRLITYAVWWIRSYIHDYIQKNWSLVKIGTTQAQRKLFYKLQKEKDEMSKLKIEHTPKLLAEKLGVREKDVIEMDKRMKGRDLSLNAPIGEEDQGTHIDFVVDDEGNAEQILSEEEEKALIAIRMKKFEQTLKGRDLFIYQKRMISENPMSLQLIGDHYKVSKERTRQLEEKIKNKLKSFLLSSVE